MAITYTDNGGGAANGSDLEFTFTFPVIQTEDVKVALDGVTQATTKYAVDTASNPTKITFNNTSVDSSVQESTGAPKSGVRVRVYRETTVGKSTGDDDPKAVFAAGSSIRATDLNANVEQALYAIHELQNRPIETEDIQDLAVTSSKIEDGTIVNADVNASAAIAGTKIAPDFGSQNIATTGTVNDVTTTELSILDGATVSTAELNILDGATITTAELNALDGFTGNSSELNTLDGVTASTSELNILDGVTATTAELNILDGVTATTAELNKLDGFTGTAANLNSISGLTASATELNLNDGQTATPTEVNILDGATVSTTELNKLDGYTGSTADLNEVVAGKNVVETISVTATDAQIPTAQAVNERITTVVSDVGGFVPIANETSFPTDNPDLDNAAGTIVSIKALSSPFTTGSGVTTHTFTNGAGSGNNVTITGLTQSTTYPAGRGMLLETTTTSGNGSATPPRAYAFHRLTLDETGVAAAQAAIDDWDERYYGPLGSTPNTRPGGGSRVQGDLYFSTADNQMKVWNNAASQWDDVASSASSNIVTLTPAFNNSETEFTCSTVPVDAQSLLLSINGVIQKPNSGTSTPSEGYVKLTNGKIKLATAPASGADYFAIALGNTVSVGTPSPNTVGATELKTGEIANTHVSSSAAIAGTKISPDFGGQAITTTNHITCQNILTIGGVTPRLIFTDSDENPDYTLWANSGVFKIYDTTNSATRLQVNTDGHVDIAGNLDVGAGVDVTGNITVSGTVDGVDIAALNTTVGNLSTDIVSDTSPQLGGALASNGHNILFADGDTAKFGTGNDLNIYHNGSHSYISDQGTGKLRVLTNSFRLLNAADGENMIAADENGAVELYHDNAKKIETTSSGATVTGTLTATSFSGDGSNLTGVSSVGGATGASFNDNVALTFGTGNDATLKHDGYSSLQLGYSSASVNTDIESSQVPPGLRILNNSNTLNGMNGLYFASAGGMACTGIYARQRDTATSSGGEGCDMYFYTKRNGQSYMGPRAYFSNYGHFLPATNGTYNLGSSSLRWGNIYTNDLHLSNKGHTNDVDGTWGDWTIQEGESDLFLKNNRSGKKYKFNLTEVS